MEAAAASLFAIFTIGAFDRDYRPAVRAFGCVTSSLTRAEMISQAANAFFYYFDQAGLYHQTEPFKKELKALLGAYIGWLARRNDVAHGCVTENQMQDFESEDQGVGTFYLLCPSHSSSRKWPIDWEPVYQYRADEIEKFGAEFEELDKRFIDYAERMGERWQKGNSKKL